MQNSPAPDQRNDNARGSHDNATLEGGEKSPTLRRIILHNFSFIIPGVLAGSDHPYNQSDLQTLADKGIQVVVTALDVRINEAAVKALGMEYHFMPVPDMTPPPLKLLLDFVELVDRYRARNWPVVVHCEAGCGRTGTFLAAYLISQGMSPKEAIEEVRTKRPCSIETEGQEEILYQFARAQEVS